MHASPRALAVRRTPRFFSFSFSPPLQRSLQPGPRVFQATRSPTSVSSSSVRMTGFGRLASKAEPSSGSRENSEPKKNEPAFGNTSRCRGPSAPQRGSRSMGTGLSSHATDRPKLRISLCLRRSLCRPRSFAPTSLLTRPQERATRRGRWFKPLVPHAPPQLVTFVLPRKRRRPPPRRQKPRQRKK